MVGEFTEYLNSKSFAKVIFLNISLKFPAMVISFTGYLNSQPSIRKPVAPTEKSPVTKLVPCPIVSVTYKILE